MTWDFSASAQYSLQYLLPSSGGQSHAPCAHLPVGSLAMRRPPQLFYLKAIQLLGDSVRHARPVHARGQDDGQFKVTLSLSGLFQQTRQPVHDVERQLSIVYSRTIHAEGHALGCAQLSRE